MKTSVFENLAGSTGETKQWKQQSERGKTPFIESIKTVGVVFQTEVVIYLDYEGKKIKVSWRILVDDVESDDDNAKIYSVSQSVVQDLKLNLKVVLRKFKYNIRDTK